MITEMVSAYGLLYKNARTWRYLDFADEERPLGVQLFGDDPGAMARAAEMILGRPHVPDLLDINMGCPVRKVCKTGAGAALLGDPVRAVAVAAAVVKAAKGSGIPVTVKLRSGLRPGDRTAVELAPRLEAVGVAGLAVHPRAASEFYYGRADHAVTAAVAGAVSVPVIASGDIDGVETALGVVEKTGAEAIMVARGAAGNPWLVGALLSDGALTRPPLAEVVADLRRLLARAEDEMGGERAAKWCRRLLGWYLRPSGIGPDKVEEMRRLADSRALDEALESLAGEPGAG